MKWRLGCDLGTNSLGWAALQLDDEGKPCGIIAAGSRIFSDGRDPKSGASLAVDRRDARAMRRRRDRFKQRQRGLLKHLTADGLFPTDPVEREALKALDPFELRARALDEALPLHHLGRAFFHLNQRRGFKSNRKADKPDDESGKVKIGIGRLEQAINERGARTFGEFLHLRRVGAIDANAIPSVRTRLRPEAGEDAKGNGYDFYPGRALIEDEFREIWEAQAPHHPEVLTPEVYERLFETVFYQRPLKSPQIGTCTLVAGDRRLPKAHPLFQRRRLLEELNALMIVRPGERAERLTHEERDLLFLKLKDKAKVSFETLRLRVLKLDPDARFNKESENRTELKGDEVAALMGAKTRFGNLWVHLSPEAQWAVVERLSAVESDADERSFRDWLAAEHGLSPEQAAAVLSVHLPQGYGRFGLEATTRLIEALRFGSDPDGRVIVYSEAVERAGFRHHSDFRTVDVHSELPYYGVALERHIMPGTGEPSDPDEMRIGRLTNPTVHIGLNQLRRVVNALIRTYGPPAEIAIELARELKLTDDDKKRLNRENNENRLGAERRSEKLAAIGQPDTGANRARLKLWEELNLGNVLDRRCIYTGQQISIEMLFSDAVDIDHILPFAGTLDDSNTNKIVCMREANRAKRKRSPYEAWGHTPQWEEIAARAAQLPRNKRWRFEPDAMERFKEEGGFLARHLVDTQYLARLSREYLAALYPEAGGGSGHVWVSPGRLTEMVRRKLGLNDLLPDHNFGGGADQPKNRLDHRHHAIDAVVIAIVDRSLLQKIAHASGQAGAEGRERIMVPEPWVGFRDDLRAAVSTITVSHRVDHGTASKAGLPKGRDATAARLHNDTAYGFTDRVDSKGNPLVVHRVPLEALKPEHLIDGGSGAKPAWVADADLRRALADATKSYRDKGFGEAVQRFAEAHHCWKGLRRVRILEPTAVIPIRDKSGNAYKGYKGDSNYRYDIWEMPDGKWKAEVMSMFDAHQSTERKRPHPAAKRVMQLHRDDVIAIERGLGQCELMRVVKFSDKQFAVAPLNEGGALKARDADKGDPFKYAYPSPGTLKSWRARKVGVDEIGRVRDPGFPMRTAVRRTRI
ncbi:type II CRISPR RNA-guided endonuclease Cas9 [Sphingomonas sp. HITSZ_GF]|uniref:type II CRISPR RNA-guided endonuclease Cas9 n=1 Tax=Sphingomonas sp. HITSZ_GF TaxID=3037247 RepID=UPI00240E18DE|nr:type II CRISPR RNA-guided endonuclease Cas9 [Sphingomonas sp. HITSZ_GF]MDG2533846.1 type II CRISPR RNA-guided endonuclease Cas9 [Sphingomonas sp. HITSZ_GF]